MCSNLNSFGPQGGKCGGHTRLRAGLQFTFAPLPSCPTLSPICVAVKATLLLFMFGLASLWLWLCRRLCALTVFVCVCVCRPRLQLRHLRSALHVIKLLCWHLASLLSRTAAAAAAWIFVVFSSCSAHEWLQSGHLPRPPLGGMLVLL